MNRMTDQLRSQTGKADNLNSKPRFFITAHPDEQSEHLDHIIKLLQDQQDCIVYYFDVEQSGAQIPPGEQRHKVSEERIAEVLGDMQLVVAVVTKKFLAEPNPAMDSIIPYALGHGIPVLPLMMEADPAKRYQKKFGDLQFLVPDDPDPTAIPFPQKLSSFLSEVIVSDETAQKVRDAFDALVFLSYRKKDREYARELMRMIHRNPRYRDIAFWYDEFLVPGEDFNKGINKALDESDLFTMVVTPNLLEDPNFVMYHEYPAARDAGKRIFPVIMKELSADEKAELTKRYQGIPESADGDGSPHWDDALAKQMQRLALKTGTRTGTGDMQHTFLIGLAYLDGINMEVDLEKGVAMITEAAEAGLEEAMRKLSSMYNTGKGVPRSVNKAADWQKELCHSLEERYRKNRSDENLQALCKEQNILGNRLHRARRVAELYACIYDQKTWMEEAAERKLPGSRHDLAVCLSKLGEVGSGVGETWKGVKYCGQAIEIFRSLQEEDPTDSARCDLYIACRYQASIYGKRQDWEEALAAYRAAREPLMELQTEEYRDSLSKDMTALWNEEGDILHNLHRADEAAEAYEKAREYAETAYTKQKTPAGRRSLISTYDTLMRQYNRTGKKEKAKEYCLRAIELLKEELEEARENGLRLNGLYSELGDFYDWLGDRTSAIRCYRDCLETPEEDPDGAQARETRTNAQYDLFILLYNTGHKEEAAEFFRQMRENLAKLYEDTRNPEYLERLANRLENEAGYQDDDKTDIRMLEEVFDMRQQLWNIMGNLDYRVRREALRNRLNRLYEMFPEKKLPWVMICDDSEPERDWKLGHMPMDGFRALMVPLSMDWSRQCSEIEPDIVVLEIKSYSTQLMNDLKSELHHSRSGPAFLLVGDRAAQDKLEEGVRMGARGYLLKPITMEQLQRKLKEILEQK